MLSDVKRIVKPASTAPPEPAESTVAQSPSESQLKLNKAISSNPQQPSSSIGVPVEVPTFPMSGRQAVQLYGGQGLTDYEKIEVRNYSDVYFLGL